MGIVKTESLGVLLDRSTSSCCILVFHHAIVFHSIIFYTMQGIGENRDIEILRYILGDLKFCEMC